MKKSIVLFTVLLFASCGTFKQVVTSEPYTPKYANGLQGKILGILPVEVSYSGLHNTLFDIDVRDINMTVNGQKVDFGNYLLKDKSEELGSYGVLDTNIFKKSKMDTQPLSDLVTNLILGRLNGSGDFDMGFFKGFGPGEMGVLSSRALEIIPNAYPQKYNYIGEPLPLLPKTTILAKDTTAPADLFLRSRLALGSELVEILEGPDAGGKLLSEIDSMPKTGEYILVLKGFFEFSVVDKSGTVLYSDRTPLDHPVNNIANELIKMPLEKGNSDAYYKYFREQDFKPYALAVINKFLPGVYPYFSSYFVNTFKTVEVIEEKK